MASECQDILETESETIFLFFSLGQGIEELDRQLRLQQDETTTLAKVGHIVSSLEHLGWSDLEQTWAQLQEVPNNTHFFSFFMTRFNGYLRLIHEIHGEPSNAL